jgi:hypothetical protein
LKSYAFVYDQTVAHLKQYLIVAGHGEDAENFFQKWADANARATHDLHDLQASPSAGSAGLTGISFGGQDQILPYLRQK